MAERVVLHLGLMKSGTSYLQHRLARGKRALAGQGVLFPGRRWAFQAAAVTDLLGWRRRPDARWTWDDLCAEVNRHQGTAVVSMEFLATASPAAVERAVSSFPGASVTAVLTVRDLARTIPAMWQESVKNADSAAFADYLEQVRQGTGLGRNFWREQAVARIAGRWAEQVGTDATTVVTVPPTAARGGLLWERFCTAAGIPADAAADSAPVNESLGAASTELLRRVNAALEATRLPWGEYAPVVKHWFAKEVLAGHRDHEDRLGFTVPDWVHGRAGRMRGRIGELGVPVLGDLSELEPSDVPGVRADRIGAPDLLRTATHAWAELRRQRSGLAGTAELPTGGDPGADLDTVVAALVGLLRAEMIPNAPPCTATV